MILLAFHWAVVLPTSPAVTVTGAPSIAVAGDFPLLNQNTTGTAGGLSANIIESQVTGLVTDLSNKVSTSQTVNGHALSGPVTVTASDVGNTTAQWNANKITETSGPTVLTVGAIADGQFAKRVGSTLVGAAPGAGSFVATQVVVDLGSTPGDEFEVTVTDAACTSASKVVCSMAYIDTSDNDADEIAFSKVFCAAGLPTAGSFTASIMAADGPIQGHFALNYALG